MVGEIWEVRETMGKKTIEFQSSWQVKVLNTPVTGDERWDNGLRWCDEQQESLWSWLFVMQNSGDGEVPKGWISFLGGIEKCLHNFVVIIKWNNAFQMLTWCLVHGMPRSNFTYHYGYDHCRYLCCLSSNWIIEGNYTYWRTIWCW